MLRSINKWHSKGPLKQSAGVKNFSWSVAVRLATRERNDKTAARAEVAQDCDGPAYKPIVHKAPHSNRTR